MPLTSLYISHLGFQNKVHFIVHLFLNKYITDSILYIIFKLSLYNVQLVDMSNSFSFYLTKIYLKESDKTKNLNPFKPLIRSYSSLTIFMF